MIRDMIDAFHLEDIQNDLHPSVLFQHEAYDLFILRLPRLLLDKSLDYNSQAFIITETGYYHYDKENAHFIDLHDIHGFYKVVDDAIDQALASVTFHAQKIEAMEDRIYENRPLTSFNTEWYTYKNNLIRINRVINKTVETFALFMRSYKKEADYLDRNFEDLFEHLQRAQRNSGHLLEKLDSIYDFHLTKTNEEMNRIIYILTLLSGIFLPLNLIVGFFGMNTTALPFTQGDSGTVSVLLVLITTALIATSLTLLIKKR
jgi:magnesium transporter